MLLLRVRSRYNQSVTANAVQQLASADFPTRWGKFRIHGFRAEFGSDGNRRVEETGASRKPSPW